MSIDDVLIAIDALLEEPLNPLQKSILVDSWQGKTYQEIAVCHDYDADYMREVGSKIWHLLSQALDEHITKRTCRQVLERYFRQQCLSPENRSEKFLKSNHFPEALTQQSFLVILIFSDAQILHQSQVRQ